MSSEVEPGPDIELHFCQACGVSIPQADIDAGRARPEPDTCAWIGTPERCPIKFAEMRAAVTAPTRPAFVKAAPRRNGTMLLMTMALLYVVGVTTFLLSRELNREPPKLLSDNLATVDGLQQVAKKIEQVEVQTRDVFNTIKGNNARQRQDLGAMSESLNTLRHDMSRLQRVVRTDIEDLQSTIITISNRTGLLKETAETIQREVRGLRDRVGQTAGTTTTPPPTKTGGDEASTKKTPPSKSRAEIERERLVMEYISKLKDRKASDQTRYNAAVQLGDLKHPDAVPPLIEALEKDRYDLVCRAAAWSLGMFGKDAVQAIPALIGQIGGKQEYVGYMCERALGEITKVVTGKAVTFNFDPTMSLRERRKVQKKWEEWWAKHQAELLPDN